MLVSFTVGNFLSFNEDQEFTMVANNSNNHVNHIIPRDNIELLRFSAIYGANASGKSNLIKAFDYSIQALFNQLSDDEIKKGFVGDLRHRDLSGNRTAGPSHFQFSFLLEHDPRLFILGFDYNTKKSRIESEWLVAKSGDEDDIIYNMNYSDMSNSFSSHESINKIIRQMSVNDIDGSETMLLWILGIGFDNPDDDCNQFEELLCDIIGEILSMKIHTSVDDDFRIPITLNELDLLVKELNRYDTGITGYRLQPVLHDYDHHWDKIRFKRNDANLLVFGNATDIGSSSFNQFDNHLSLISASGSLLIHYQPSKVYASEGYAEVQFLHSFGINSIPFREESEGTKRLIRLLCSLHGMRGLSGTAIVDEMECNIHPLAVNKFLHDFINNPDYKEVQLIITTHDSRLLNYDTMRREEIWFSESRYENHDRYTELYSLQSFVDDSGVNIDIAYLEGRFGAIPIFDNVSEEANKDAY